MTVVKQTTGYFVVGQNGEPIDGPFESNAQAWRRIDRLLDEPTSPKEKAVDWMWSQWKASA